MQDDAGQTGKMQDEMQEIRKMKDEFAGNAGELFIFYLFTPQKHLNSRPHRTPNLIDGHAK